MTGQPALTTLTALQSRPALALLKLDGDYWLLPPDEVRAVESASAMDPAVRAPHSLGAIAFAGAWWPVYGLSGELRLLRQCPEQRRVCLLLDNGADRFGLVADEFDMRTPPPPLFAVPACMAPPDGPIRALARLETRIGGVTDTEGLAARLAALMEPDDG